MDEIAEGADEVEDSKADSSRSLSYSFTVSDPGKTVSIS
jgi:hypothetical protein